MHPPLRAVVHEGQIQPVEPLDLPEGTQLVIMCIDDDDSAFWKAASAPSLADAWDNPEDDVYAELL